MADLASLGERLDERFGEAAISSAFALGELTVDIDPASTLEVMTTLRDDPGFAFEQLIDLCGVDYTTFATDSQAPEATEEVVTPELAVVYHLLSLSSNRRLRVRARLAPERPMIESVVDVWPVANWFEREAFDLFGIVFHGHPDLRRLLTDYGFIGHPFRKDFPISGHVEMRYDEEKGRVVYQPVSIERRVLVPRVIRTGGYGG